ncbi:asparaginase domain-containing protein [Ditylenchus destructor]|uniref:N(4)-(beta-N-acetylglucosaminyl)-L-asparaginase n=1 Tax=Ditylenchus destructor TaxID=166010 RepID=A0AAD4N1H5_9BILA|nr:asparaginase domain-containing protein [Ditylenchus destructor]
MTEFRESSFGGGNDFFACPDEILQTYCLLPDGSYNFVVGVIENGEGQHLPLVVSTWYTEQFGAAAQKAWDTLVVKGQSRMQALVSGLSECETLQCDGTVGYGGSPDEMGETTLDSLVMDGPEHKTGAVAALRRVKNAAQVAWAILNYTEHSLLVGEKATQFAISMGFKEESLEAPHSRQIHEEWLAKKCQPNFWKIHIRHVAHTDQIRITNETAILILIVHDTIGMIVIDELGHISAGTSSNGATNKIPGRVGDSPIIGSGAYVDDEIGAAVATGDGDIMMRFSPSFLAVELMRQGSSPSDAASEAIRRIRRHYPKFFGGIVIANRQGQFSAACSGMAEFSYSAVIPNTQKVAAQSVKCISGRVTREANVPQPNSAFLYNNLSVFFVILILLYVYYPIV